VDAVTNSILAAILTLQVASFSLLMRHEKRISTMETDLYQDPKNPLRLSITEQIAEIRRKLESLEEKVTEICRILNDRLP